MSQLSRLLQVFLCIELPSFIIILVAVLAAPLFYVLRIFLRNWRIRRAAARLGAVLPPRWDGQSFANLDLLQQILSRIATGYPGAHCLEC